MELREVKRTIVDVRNPTHRVEKKVEEIDETEYNNVTSSEKESQRQLGSDTTLEDDEPLAGEEVEIERTEGEDDTERTPANQNRTSPMDGRTYAPVENVINDGDTKKYCGIPERERNPGHPANPPIPAIDDDDERDNTTIELLQKKLDYLTKAPADPKTLFESGQLARGNLALETQGKQIIADRESAEAEAESARGKAAVIENVNAYIDEHIDPIVSDAAKTGAVEALIGRPLIVAMGEYFKNEAGKPMPDTEVNRLIQEHYDLAAEKQGSPKFEFKPGPSRLVINWRPAMNIDDLLQMQDLQKKLDILKAPPIRNPKKTQTFNTSNEDMTDEEIERLFEKVIDPKIKQEGARSQYAHIKLDKLKMSPKFAGKKAKQFYGDKDYYRIYVDAGRRLLIFDLGGIMEEV